MGSGVCLSVRLSVPCLNITRERKGLGSSNLAGWKPITRITREPIYRSKGQRSKVKVTRPINVYTLNAQYLPNGKVYELQTWYTDGERRPASATSAVTSKVAMSRDASDRCWPISRERNFLATSKLVGRSSTPRAIMAPVSRSKGQARLC